MGQADDNSRSGPDNLSTALAPPGHLPHFQKLLSPGVAKREELPGVFQGRSALGGEGLGRQCLEMLGLRVLLKFGGGSCQGIPRDSRL